MFRPIFQALGKRSSGIVAGERRLPGSVGGGLIPDFFAPLTVSIVQQMGSGSPAFTRATAATVQDWEARVYNVLSGEVRFQGARRVANVIANGSENDSWNTATNVTRTTGQTDPNGGTSAIKLTATGANALALKTNASTSTALRNSMWLKRVTGTGTVSLTNADNSFTDITAVLTTSWQRFAGPVSASSGGFAACGVKIVTSGDEVAIAFMQQEDVLGQSNQNPAEYVSKGVLSSPYYGANVDGVRYFPTQNGNTVASNVVTEATGAAISTSILLGYLSEQQSTNLVLQSENFGTTWAAVGTPTRVAGNTRCGAVVLDLIGDDDGAALEGYTQTITFTGNAAKAVSLFVAQGTSTSTAIRLRDTTGAADRLLAVITWSGGIPTVTMTTGTLLGVDTLGNSVFRIRLQTTSVTAANTNSLQVYPATDAALAVGNTGNVNVGGVQAEDNQIRCTSYIPTTTATVTRNVDLLTHPVAGNISDTAGTAYCEFRVRENDASNTRGLVADGAGVAAYPLAVISGPAVNCYDGTSSIAATGSATVDVVAKAASTWTGAARATYRDGANKATGAYDGTITPAALNIGIWGGVSAQALNGTIRNVRIWKSALTDAQIAAL